MPIHIAQNLNPLVKFLFMQAKEQKISDAKINKAAGLGQSTLSGWNRGREPSLANYQASLNVLGFELVVIRKKGDQNNEWYASYCYQRAKCTLIGF